jgi:hypothetical protein
MSEPTTEAGRRLTDYLVRSIVTTDQRRAAFLTDVLAIEAEARAAIIARPRVAEQDDLGAAWAEAEAARPEGWRGPSIAQNWRGRWYAYVYQHHEDAPANPGIVAYMEAEDHDTPAAAVRALVAKLREPKS